MTPNPSRPPSGFHFKHGSTAKVILRALVFPLAFGLLCGCQSTHPAECRFPSIRLLAPYVGQGHGIALASEGRAIVFDAGPPEQSGLVAALRRADIDTIEAIYLTHPDLDHRGGLDSLFANFPVERLAFGPLDSARRRQTLGWACPHAFLGCDTVWSGRTRYHHGGMRIDILWPDSGAVFQDDNQGSLVLRVSQGDRGLLLVSGDLDTVGEADVSESVKPVEVLQLGHHGSRSSGLLRFLGKAAPTKVVVQYGRDNDYGHPTAQALARVRAIGATLLDPAATGDLVVDLGADGCAE